MADTAGHFSDDELAEFDDDGSDNHNQRIRDHVQFCQTCRRQHEALVRLRELLAQTGHRERRPVSDVVPSAMKRLRLRRHSVTNANELLEGFAALVRGLASLFSLPTTEQRLGGHTRGAKDEQHE